MVFLGYMLKYQEEEIVEIRHIIANCFGLLQALSLQLHAQSKLNDAAQLYARHQYYQAKNELRIINQKKDETELPEELSETDSDEIGYGH